MVRFRISKKFAKEKELLLNAIMKFLTQLMLSWMDTRDLRLSLKITKPYSTHSTADTLIIYK